MCHPPDRPAPGTAAAPPALRHHRALRRERAREGIYRFKDGALILFFPAP